jgi:Secretion system C-terminal sorting domain
MKKIALLTFMLCVSAICFTQNQTLLTVREVYDFAIGDTFQYEVKNNALYLNGRTERIVIMDKWFSTRKDTVFYKQKYERYGVDYVWSGHIVTDYERKEEIMKYTNLDSVINYNISRVNCPKINSRSHYCTDSIYKSYNQRNTYLFDNEIMLFAGSKKVFSEGLGMTVREQRSEDYPSNNSTKLIYFHKGNEVWGEPKPIITSDNTPSVFYDKITISPNPAKDIIYLETDIDFDKIQIININGQAVLRENKTYHVPISDLPNGIYFLQIYDKSVLKSDSKIIVNH